MRQYRMIFIAILYIVITPLIAFSEKKPSQLDGYDWRRADFPYKAGYVVGFMASGYYLITNNIMPIDESYSDDQFIQLTSRMGIVKSAPRFKGKKEFTVTDMDTYWESCKVFGNQRLYSHALTQITGEQLMEGLDKLYEDFKNRGILMADAIFVVKKQIQGTPQEDIDRILIYLRSGKVNHRSLVVEDEKSNFVRAITFP